MIKYKIISTPDFEVTEVREKYVCKKGDKFFVLSKDEFDKLDISGDLWQEVSYSLFDILFLFVQLVTIFFATIIMFNLSHMKPEFNLFSIILIILLFTIHEGAHYLVLRFYGKKSRYIKPTLYYFILPGIKIDVKESVLLLPIQRINIYLAGVFLSSLTLNLLYYFSSIDNGLFFILYVNVLLPVLPLDRTDGYNILLVLLNIFPKNGEKNKVVLFIKFLTTIILLILIVNVIISFLK